MNSIRHLLLPRKKSSTFNFKSLIFSDHFSHTLASNTTHSDTQTPIIAIANILSNCSSLHELNQIYAQIIRTEFLKFYPDQFHWNNIIRSYTRLDAPTKALRVYISMSRCNVLPDSYTLPIALKAACQAFAIGIGKQLHSVAIRVGLESNEYCESGFITLYSKSGEFEDASKVFDENPERKLGSWNAIIGGLAQGGRAKEAIEMFIKMRKYGLEPDDVTMVSVTSACGSIGDFNLAIQLHKYVFQAKKRDGKSDILMLNSLIDMYGKCGRMDLADRVFSEMDQKNVSSWTSMIVGYAFHGHVNEAISCFHSMIEAKVRPNHVTFVGLLSACVHGGQVQEGKKFFEMMKSVYGILPQQQHYGCMVDLLGRVGLVGEARELIEGMPMQPNVVIWGCLMGACEKFGDVKTAEWVGSHLQELEPWNDGGFVVLSNIYASKGLWYEVERVRRCMKLQRVAKVPAYSLATCSN
ncbi:pentatricopeptide repeat-containing protein At1g77170, mitochondrial [Euphorbia lathyris]|uniref:pentatricopeptide repeat-containing protein At1g77170, mitochondrial n=1 Tax=Euphorbia lathyris TaxID=212925 RepID=UPI0033141022